MRRWALLSALVAVVVGGTVAVALATDRAPTAAPVATPPAVEGSRPPSGERIDWLAASAGATPEFNQVSLEQDLQLVSSVLAGRGRVLFAAGASRPVVQVLAPAPTRDDVTAVLADFFAPRGGRDATYRAPQIPVDGPATRGSVLDALRDALAVRTHDPLLVFLGGHGHPGETPIDNAVGLWGSSQVTAGELAGLLDARTRPSRFVITTCYSGGFAEIVFADGAAEMGAATAEVSDRCGLFASPWDLEASGCDPNPDRSIQEGYALHFFNALAGRDRDGTALARSELDLDADGRISLLEAHTRVRIASKAPDVPTTTSERWLRHQFPTGLPEESESAPVELAEEAMVVEALTRQLGLDDPNAASAELARLEQDHAQRDQALIELQAAEESAYFAAAADLLARWPVLDDPWHPEFARTLAEQRDAVAEHLARAESFAAYLQARDEVDQQTRGMADLRARAAPLERLSRAVDNLAMAAVLARRGGAPWDRSPPARLRALGSPHPVDPARGVPSTLTLGAFFSRASLGPGDKLTLRQDSARDGPSPERVRRRLMPTFAGASAVAIATTERSITVADAHESGSTLYPTAHRAPRLTAAEELSLALRLQRQRRALWTELLSDLRWRRTIATMAIAALDEDRRPASLPSSTDGLQLPADALEAFVAEMAEADRDAEASREVLRALESSDADANYVRRCQDARDALHRTRDAFIEANLGLVVMIAKRYERGHLTLEDLVQEGNAGLLKAVDRFDPERGFRFSTYAVWWIRHAIGRALSDKSREIRLPVHVAERQQTLLHRRKKFEARHGRSPTAEELAGQLGWPLDRVTDLLSVEYTRAVGHDRQTQSRAALDVDRLAVEPDLPDFDAEVLHLHLLRGLRELPPMQRDILARRFGLDGEEPMTLREVGLRHNLSRERIRQLQERALASLRRQFTRHGLV